MAKEPVPTHLNAYLVELQEAEAAAVQAKAKVRRLKHQINDKLAEEGKDPMFFTNDNGEDGKKRGRPAKNKENAPDEATGFGGRHPVGGSN